MLAVDYIFKTLPVTTKPGKTAMLEAFDAPKDVGDDYGARVRGFVYPAQSGEYVFSITSDDDSELLLSTDNSPDKKKCVAYVRGFAAAGQFDANPSQKSKPIRLEAGKQYYIEALHKEGSGGDHLTVAWSGPGVTEGIIQGKYLSPYPTGAKGKIGHEMWLNLSTAGMADSVTKPEPPIKPVPGVIHVEAEAFTNMFAVRIFDCYTGGKQVDFGKSVNDAWVEYTVDVPAAGVYDLAMRIAAANVEQVLNVKAGAAEPVTVKVPWTTGLWGMTEPVAVTLNKGKQTLRVTAPNQRGVALRWLELKKAK